MSTPNDNSALKICVTNKSTGKLLSSTGGGRRWAGVTLST
jgi:hypothetical protein